VVAGGLLVGGPPAIAQGPAAAPAATGRSNSIATPGAPERIDPLAQAVVDSLRARPRTTPAEHLGAAIRAAEVDAPGAAAGFFADLVESLRRLDDGQRPDTLADLGDGADDAALSRLERLLTDRDEDAAGVLAAIRAASRSRRRDPALLRSAAADLANPDGAPRRAALERLAAAGVDALPALAEVLGSADPARAPARPLAQELVAALGDDARAPLLSWLATAPVGQWPGIIAALDASNAADIDDFLLAPAKVAGTPPAVRARAAAILAAREGRRHGPGEAVARLAARLDRVLGPAGLPEVECDPLAGPPTVDRVVWNGAAGRFDRVALRPRAARSLDALHLARDLGALDVRDPAVVRLVLLARVEALLLAAGDPATALEAIEPERLTAALTGPDGTDPALLADLVDEAVAREMPEAAAAVLRELERIHTSTPDLVAPALPPALSRSLARLVDAPDETVAFAAARTLALTGGGPAFPGASRVVARLVRSASSRGVDKAVVAHPELAVVESLATAISRHGYEPLRAGTGLDAVHLVRADPDVTLVLLAARLGHPAAFETVQLLRDPGHGDLPQVMVVVDPLDDLGRGRKLTQLTLQARAHDHVALVDRRESFFQPHTDPQTGLTVPARFTAALTATAGPEAADPARRQARASLRLARARQALDLLAILGARGWDVTAAADTARRALGRAELVPPALALLATIGTPDAQAALLERVLDGARPPEERAAALAALRDHVERFGGAIDCGRLEDAVRGYNLAADADSRDLAGAVLDAYRAALPPPEADGPPQRTRR
jgi:hypothetical protein